MPRYRIPVRVVGPTERVEAGPTEPAEVDPTALHHLAPARPRVPPEEEASVGRVRPGKEGHVGEPRPVLSGNRGHLNEPRAPGQGPGEVSAVLRTPARAEGHGPNAEGSESCSSVEWQERALRLQAEMENYRKRQQRMAQDQARHEQERLLLDVLAIADNLDRTLSAAQAAVPRADEPIRQGVALTRDELDRILSRYDVERIAALHRPFDPRWHEALGVRSAAELGVEADTVVEVLQAGYRRGERLLRPARVVVAQ